MSAAFIGLDLAKSVFQVHGVDVHCKVVVTKQLRRDCGAGVLRQPDTVRGWDGGLFRVTFLILLVTQRLVTQRRRLMSYGNWCQH